MIHTIHVHLRGKGFPKEFKVTAREAGVYPWPDWFTGVLSSLTEADEFAFLDQDCVVEATYKAHRYRPRLVEREGLFQAWLAVKPEPTWPAQLEN